MKLFNRMMMGRTYLPLMISFVVSLFIYVVIATSNVHLNVKPFFFYASTGLFTFFIARQTIQSMIKDRKFNSILQLPFIKNHFLFSLACSTYLYVLGTKTLVLFAIFSSVMNPKLDIIISGFLIIISCCIHGILFALPKKRLPILSVSSLIICGGLSWFERHDLVLVISLISILLAGVIYIKKDPYDFIQSTFSYKQKAHIARGNFYTYLYRYFIFHKNYLTNSVFILVLAILLPFMFVETKMGSFYLLGLGILSINTPMSILFSSNRSILEKVKSLPNQKAKLILPYFLLLFIWNFIPSLIYLVLSKFFGQPYEIEHFLLVICLVILNSVGVILLEWYFPIKNWHVESDLWHHPRKYVMPGILMILIMMVMIIPSALMVVGVLALMSIGIIIIFK